MIKIFSFILHESYLTSTSFLKIQTILMLKFKLFDTSIKLCSYKCYYVVLDVLLSNDSVFI